MAEVSRTGAEAATDGQGELAVVLTGGGARAAYQVGFLRCLARRMPDLRFPIVVGVSAGAINAAYLAAHRGSLADAAAGLSELWRDLEAEEVFRVGTFSLGRNVVRWGARLVSGGAVAAPEVRSLLDTAPLQGLLARALGAVDGELTGVAENLDRGRLKAFSLTTLRYSTAQTVSWVQGCEIPTWERPHRISINTRMRVEHVMASAALPLVFPAIRLANDWHGDGGMRLTTPLSPAIHLGASRILAVSTRYARTREEASRPVIRGYPPPAQVLGALLNAIFLDALDQDALRLKRLNMLLNKLPEDERAGLKPVDLILLRPSRDLGRLAAQYEVKLPKAFRFLTRGLGTRETASPDFLSLLMFQSDYLRQLIEIGEEDAESRLDEIRRLIAGGGGE